ncbi:type II toxin-antitoxin system VapC family toxin [Inquilinus limosus]|uniref:type II toxin-antitoxin system VapC family toxin n=1 Tax=Inquilinus limosus TaxID=171674 RepID=UPI003F156BFD
MLDTNICIHLIQRHPPQVLNRFAALSQGDVVMSVVTLAELRHGVERDPAVRPQAEQALDQLLDFIPAQPFDTDAAIRYGVLAAAVRDRRRDVLDRMIAAHALSLGVILVTNNEVDFSPYPGLTVENWGKA